MLYKIVHIEDGKVYAGISTVFLEMPTMMEEPSRGVTDGETAGERQCWFTLTSDWWLALLSEPYLFQHKPVTFLLNGL